MCKRDDTSASLRAKIEWFSPICNVYMGEALGCLLVLNWVHELNLKTVDFKLDSKSVSDKFPSNKM